ncbi:MAG: 5-methylthioadenosine/S-adenosylhomocysteine nucleosidase [Herminiimonas sp.]|nr:5-methylthioadenosine/S-adenosylhomocysteine nucleosidase [Herminiimonas sp.]
MSIEVLLLEDDPAKKNRLLAFLQSKKNLFGRVDTALCTSDAKKFMRERKYDLLIADIVVPTILGGEKSETHTMALLEEIDDGVGDIFPPTFCLPISASSELSDAAHHFFLGRPWGILAYTDSSDECLESIEKICRFVINEKGRLQEVRRCDIFIITALMEPEFTAVESLPLDWGVLEPLDRSQLVKYGHIQIGGQGHVVAAAFATRMGPTSAAILTTKALLMLRPKLVIMTGICAGIPGKAHIGDVVAVDISWDWQSGKFVDKSGIEAFQIAPHQLGIGDTLRNQLLLFKRDADYWDTLAGRALKEQLRLPKLVMGPMATGSSVLADSRVSERIKTNQHKNVVGLDMETYGVFAAVEACDPKVTVLSLKAVCDNGDIKKNDDYQEYAAVNAALAVERFLTEYAGPLLGT